MENLSDLPFALETVHGEAAYETLMSLRSQSQQAIPVVLGDDEELERLLEVSAEDERDYAEILAAANDIDVLAWVAEKHESYLAMMAEYGDAEADLDDDEDEADGDADEAEFEAGADDDEGDFMPHLSTLAYDIVSGEAKPRVHIGLIPVAESWQVPAYLKIGDWNECPEAAVHVAFFKYWYEQYGAVVTAISSDTIEFSVTRPPLSIEQARVLARQQYMYCADIVDQGVESEENLAQTLLNADNWFFWWD